jgi:hypothetical protein
MKKLFLALMLVAAFAMSFVSCEKKTTESETHSQTFTLGEASYAIDNAITIENIQYNGSKNYNAIILSQGQMIGNNGGEGKGVVIVFQGAITTGTFHPTFDPLNPAVNFPKYFVAELEVDDIVNFSIENLMSQEDVYVAKSGSFTLAIDNVYTITTDGIEVEKVSNHSVIETSSVDYEGGVERYVLATVEEGNINGTNIVTAGVTKYNIFMMDMYIAAFIAENADMIGFISRTSMANGIPVGTYSYQNYPIIYVGGMNIKDPKTATNGTITVAREGDVYTIDMTDMQFTGVDGIFTLHYVGTMPYFDFPF